VNKNFEIVQLIGRIADEFNEQLEFKIAVNTGREAPLFGHNGVLDSLGLVSFVVAVEQAIEIEIGVSLTLADEKAMSMRHSPFRTVGSLADYIEDLLKKREVDSE
jgi:D-alanine--poly(phosphoribitol) ligase subunit 2